jgi:hypothetical protein
MRRSSVMAVLLAVAAFAGGPLALGQGAQAPAEPSMATYSDAELKSFAAAAVDVHRINSTYLPRLADAGPIEQRQLEKQAQQETTQAIEKQGLTSDRYDEILAAAQAKPDVAEKVEQFLDEAPRPGAPQF